MPLFFQPARSSRHRIACLALYKALLRTASLVPLPSITDDPSLYIPPAKPTKPTPPPIKTIIRNAFRRNKHDVSPRLITSALKNGYNALTLLSSAADPLSSPYTQIVDFLRENKKRVESLRDRRERLLDLEPSNTPIPGTVPVVVKVSKEGEPPRYIPNPARPLPRPIEQIPNGIRKPPRLDAAGTVPFLRMQKPQSRVIERIVRIKNRNRAVNTIALSELYREDDERRLRAELEDEWDGKMHQLLPLGKAGGSGGYVRELDEVVGWLGRELNREREDMIARAEAFLEIERVEEEQMKKEDRERVERGEVTEEEVFKMRTSWRRNKKGREAGRYYHEEERKKRGLPVSKKRYLEGVRKGRFAEGSDRAPLPEDVVVEDQKK
ncbi:hypothetical protein QC763_405940 [Podospora pseudopauciseta]|uniref:Uncharacterized protein n=2 Tax=Podospora TaxID=5144 RepID=A0ABR0HDR7_9PEZI|nr:hypothetical protein QC763_405940 [Podospora pseudopauciseta]KAK4677373.1 hypothetical protein QC764_405940 [Podospora pseudoanserina]